MRKQEEWNEWNKKTSREIDALLTPKQVAALKEIEFRNAVNTALYSAEAQKKLGMSDVQKARLRQLEQEHQERDQAAQRATIEKSLAVLTAMQRQKLREELDRPGW